MKKLTLKKVAFALLAIGLLTLVIGFDYDLRSFPPLQDPELAPKEVVAANDAMSAKARMLYRYGWTLVGLGGMVLLINFGLRRGSKK